jgi:excisionase family DNA binding protein
MAELSNTSTSCVETCLSSAAIHNKLSPKAAAQRVGVSISLVYRWCTDGTLVHYRVRGRGQAWKILITTEDLDALLASFMVGGRPEPPPLPKPFKPRFRHLKL